LTVGAGARVVLLDVEGTTTAVAFVYDVLFPFARARLREFLSRPAAAEDRAALRRERAGESEAAPPWDARDAAAETESAIAYASWLMDRDRKSTALKALQGRIWEDGYAAGALVAHVYPDVRPALERWHGQGRSAAIYSSGSVLAQRLLFAHSGAGDLTPLLAGYFDTTTGPKREAESYRRISSALRAAPAEVLFVSDVAAELDAARTAGMATALCVREGPPPLDAAHPVVTSFAAL
jgi:enolase-phosphatase E1